MCCGEYNSESFYLKVKTDYIEMKGKYVLSFDCILR